MSNEWFYIQRWKQKRWSWVGRPLPLDEAQRLFDILSNEMSAHNFKPLALVENDGEYKVILNDNSEGQNIIDHNGKDFTEWSNHRETAAK